MRQFSTPTIEESTGSRKANCTAEVTPEKQSDQSDDQPEKSRSKGNTGYRILFESGQSMSRLWMRLLFPRVQEVLRQHDKHKQRTQRHRYLLRGLVYSLDANSTCWAETHTRKRISYYRSRLSADENHVFYNTRDIEEQLPGIFGRITITEDTRQQLRKELADWFDAEAATNGDLKKTEARLVKLERMEKNLQRLVLEEDISFKDFKDHRSRIEAEKVKLKNTVDAKTQRQHLVKADFEVALQLSTELRFLFDRGNFNERRLLCETVLKRLYVREEKVEKVELNSPFALIASRAKSSESVINGGRYWT